MGKLKQVETQDVISVTHRLNIFLLLSKTFCLRKMIEIVLHYLNDSCLLLTRRQTNLGKKHCQNYNR